MGAGPAGSAAAMSARALGLTVAIVDKARFPRDKLCGGLVSGRARKHLREIFGVETGPPRFLVSREVAFCWRGETLARFDAGYDLHFTLRIDFDHWLHQMAVAAGSDVFPGQRCSGIDTDANTLTLEDGTKLAFRALIGADGVNSQVARHLFGRAFDPDSVGFALECEAPVTGAARDPVMAVDFAAARWGYGWRFPKHESQTIGVGGISAENPDMKDRLAALLDHGGVAPGSVRIKGAFLPFGDYRRRPGKGNILLVGDAAGLVDPMTGEGIAYALDSGRLAAEAIAQTLPGGQVAQAARVYRRKIAPIHTELAKANRLRQIAFAQQFRPMFREKLQHSERMRQLFFQLLEGETSYGAIEKRLARGVLKRLGRGMTGWPRKATSRS